jgi:predicted ATPase
VVALAGHWERLVSAWEPVRQGAATPGTSSRILRAVATGIPVARFVGRGAELQRLAAALAAADAGRAAVVVVGGDAGVGKTRLLAEFAGGADAAVLRGGCLPLGESGLPFSPIVEVLRGLVGEGSSAEATPPVLARLVPGSSVDAPPGPSSQAQLFQAFLGLLEDLATTRTVILVLEDLHWADRSTRQLLTFVVHNLRAQRLLVAVGAQHVHKRRALVERRRRDDHIVSPFGVRTR